MECRVAYSSWLIMKKGPSVEAVLITFGHNRGHQSCLTPPCLLERYLILSSYTSATRYTQVKGNVRYMRRFKFFLVLGKLLCGASFHNYEALNSKSRSITPCSNGTDWFRTGFDKKRFAKLTRYYVVQVLSMT